MLRSAPPPDGKTSPSLPWSSAANSFTSAPSAAKPVTGVSRRAKKSVLVSTALTNVCTESRFRASTRSWSPNGFGSFGPHWTTTTDVGRGSFGLVAMPHSHMQYDQSSVSEVNTRITASAAPSARFSSSFSGLPRRGPSKSGLEDRCTRTLPAVLSLTNRAIASAISRSECLWLTNTRGSSRGTWLAESTRRTISPWCDYRPVIILPVASSSARASRTTLPALHPPMCKARDETDSSSTVTGSAASTPATGLGVVPRWRRLRVRRRARGHRRGQGDPRPGRTRWARDVTVKLNIGVHWGATLMVGQVATRGRLEVTALGDQMNECARIEAAAKDGASSPRRISSSA